MKPKFSMRIWLETTSCFHIFPAGDLQSETPTRSVKSQPAEHQTTFSLGEPSKRLLSATNQTPLTLQTIHRSQSVWWQWLLVFLFLLRYRYLMLHYDTSGPESSASAIPPIPIIFQNPTFGQNTLLAFFTLKNSSFELLFLTRPTRNETTFLSDMHFRI